VAGILLAQPIEEASRVELLVERAITAANRVGQWRSWNFLTLQIQIAAEMSRSTTAAKVRTAEPLEARPHEADPMEADQKPDPRTNSRDSVPQLGSMKRGSWSDVGRRSL
jgi:hypothetical protein